MSTIHDSRRYMARPLTDVERLELDARLVRADEAMDASESGDPIIAAGILNAPLTLDELEDEDPDAPDDGCILIAGILYDRETGEEAFGRPRC